MGGKREKEKWETEEKGEKLGLNRKGRGKVENNRDVRENKGKGGN